MTVHTPISVEGNLTDNPETGTTSDGKPFARFTLAVDDRQYDDEAQEWQDRGEPVFHRVAVFGAQAEHVAATLRKGDRALASGDLEFKPWRTEEGVRRQSTQIVARSIGPSLRFTTAEVDRSPKVSGPESTGPVAQTSTDATGPVASTPQSSGRSVTV